MANIVYMAKSAWTGLLDTIRSKASVSGTMTVSQATDAVNSITGGDDNFDRLIERTISGNITANASLIGAYAFSECSALTGATIPNAQSIGMYAFTGCTKLKSFSAPLVTYINQGAFQSCSSLGAVSFPLVSYIGLRAFSNCSYLTATEFPDLETISNAAFYACKYSLSTLSLPKIKTIAVSAFAQCVALSTLYLMGSSVPTLAASTAFTATKLLSGSIFVPASLYDSYISAANWSYFSSAFVSV